jgi:hypothetical protein
MTPKMLTAGWRPGLAALSVLLAVPTSANALDLDWDAGRCAAFLQNSSEWAAYSEPEINEIIQYCQPLVEGAAAAPVEAPVDPALVEVPVDPGVAPEATVPPPVSLAEWDVARCDAFLRDPNAPAMYSPDDLNALYPHCQNLVAMSAPPPVDPAPIDPAIVEAPTDPGLFPEAAPPVLSLAEWDFARCDTLLRDPNAPAMYLPDDLNALYPHCQNLVATAAPPVDPALTDPAVLAAPTDPGLLPEAAPPALSLAEWDFARCDAFLRDPNAPAMYSPGDFNAIVPHCQTILAVAIPATDPALPAGDLLPPADPLLPQPGDAALLPEPVAPPPVDGQAVGTEGGDLLLPPAFGDTAAVPEPGLPPADGQSAATGGDLLPPPVAAEGGDLLPPPSIDDGAVMPEPTLEAGLAPDAAPPVEGLPPVAMPGQPIVRMVITNASAEPLDVFVDPPAGGDPMFVVTVEPEYSIVQPTNAGRTWRLVQNEVWLGSLVTNAEPAQFFRYEVTQ